MKTDHERVLVPFQIPKDLRYEVGKFTDKRTSPLSLMIQERLELFLDETGNGELDKSLLYPLGRDYSYTSIMIPKDLKTRAQIFCVKSGISLGALLRYIVSLEVKSRGSFTQYGK